MKMMLIALAPLLILIPTIAQAEPISSRQVAISTSGFDLTTTDGASSLLRKIHHAAERGCREDANWDRWSRDFDRCRADTVNAAVAKIGAPTVTALHRGESAPTQVAAAR
jgi:UrcA family protein